MILLTGANGLLGSTIKADIRLNGRREVDLTNFDKTLDFFKKSRPETIIHCAARVGGVQANIDHMGEFYYENTLMTLNVFEAARKANVKKIVSILSTCIFPDNISYPLTPEKLHAGEPHESNFGYAYAKRMTEVQARAYQQQYGIKCLSLIPTNIYGPKDNFNLKDAHVIPALIHRCYNAVKENTSFVVWGSGKPLREFIFSEDIGNIINLLASDYEGDDSVIISTGYEYTIKEVAEVIASCFNYKENLIFDESKPDGQYRKHTNPETLRSLYPDFKYTTLKEGIQKTINWFVENYESCRK